MDMLLLTSVLVGQSWHRVEELGYQGGQFVPLRVAR
jgi:hypothetical protein